MVRIRKILIANRGEIALRIARAAKEMGIRTAAVYADADRRAPHVLYADEAYPLSSGAGAYLQGHLILQIARGCAADAIHPGYGFLSENAEFAQACEEAAIKLIGPPSSAMRVLGSKTLARQAADAAGIPRTPGSIKSLASIHEALEMATSIGYPVMLKASFGGGGKGMRSVAAPAEMEAAYRMAQSEAEGAFGSGELYVEKLIERPRHIEIQLLADEHGNCIYLGERECSVQRRHQKIIEEAPSAVLDNALRKRMGEAAVRLALSAGYTNAGTVEFLVDEQRNFYFLEVNTRLQVEHPVTELVTGLDLVQLQILVAQGTPLSMTQADVQLRGHAIECRIYAEDPENGFFPSPGRITRLVRPSGPGIREDCGIYEGWTVPMEYDPMLSKLIACAPTREGAIARMLRALDEYFIGGIQTNLQFLQRILSDPEFARAEIDTGYLDRLLSRVETDPPSADAGHMEAVAAIAAGLMEAFCAEAQSSRENATAAPGESRWKRRSRCEALGQ